jgi:8-amino-7-oxononanoate synthase
MSGRFDWLERELDNLRSRSLYRQFVGVEHAADGHMIRNGRSLLNLSSNDYLGLAGGQTPEQFKKNSVSDPRLTGATASRLVVGTDEFVLQFERDFAAFKKQEACVLFGSGYMANVGMLSALIGRDDVVFSDRLNHASIVDGLILSRADVKRYAHRDLDQLEKQLKNAAPGKRKFIVTDTVFSMDGTIAPMHDLVTLKERYSALLIVDEAHSGGIYGERGEGLAAALDLSQAVDVHMGTFSKAYGAYGAYVAGDRIMVDWLINRARSLIYTTALPPMLVRQVAANWQTAVAEGWRREQLLANSARFRKQLAVAGLQLNGSESQIVPVIVGDNETALRMAKVLDDRGIAAVAIRPPTVPDGTARLRFSLMATQTEQQLDTAATTIIETAKELGIV